MEATPTPLLFIFIVSSFPYIGIILLFKQEYKHTWEMNIGLLIFPQTTIILIFKL